MVSDISDFYFNTRLKPDLRRAKTWRYLNKYFQRYLKPDDVLLELGPGYCFFVNSIECQKKYAYDNSKSILNYLNNSVVPLIGGGFSKIPDKSLTKIFASNFFEHLTHHEISELMSLLRKKMSPTAKVIVLQPNFKYSYKQYFDDYTHKTVFTDTSLIDFFSTLGFGCELNYPKFLPYSVKSKFGGFSWLIPIYLSSPIKPLAGQMHLVFSLIPHPKDIE
jgi:hypothetical protein